jgi:hypothetical protein
MFVNKLVRVWYEALDSMTRYYCGISLNILRKTTETPHSLTTPGDIGDIRDRYLADTACYVQGLFKSNHIATTVDTDCRQAACLLSLLCLKLNYVTYSLHPTNIYIYTPKMQNKYVWYVLFVT